MAYETLKSKGLDIIQNDSIKKTIAEIYEQAFPQLIGEFKVEWVAFQILVLPFCVKNIQYINSKIAGPINFNDQKKC